MDEDRRVSGKTKHLNTLLLHTHTHTERERYREGEREMRGEMNEGIKGLEMSSDSKGERWRGNTAMMRDVG